MPESLMIGMVGAGYGGHARARAVAELGNERVRIGGVFDVKPDHAAEFASELGVKPYPTLEAICGSQEINTISIAVPNRHHYEIAKFCLERGRHVLCEYPLVFDRYEKGEELVRLARRKRLYLHVGQTMNYDADLSLIQARKGELGTLVLGYKYMSFGALGSIFAIDGFKGGYKGLWEWYVKDTRKGGWCVSAHYHGIQHFRKIFGEVVAVSAFDYRSVEPGAGRTADAHPTRTSSTAVSEAANVAATERLAAATVTLLHEGGASSSIQWGMPLLGKFFSTVIVCGSEGSIEIDGAGYSIQKGEDVQKGTLDKVNTFVLDLAGVLEELDGKRSTEAEQEDMLVNLKIAMLAEQSVTLRKVIEVR